MLAEHVAPISSETPWHRTFAWISLLACLIAYPLLLLHYQHSISSTFDEGSHMAAGYRYWQCGDYAINPEHPPLLKLIAALPIRHWSFTDFDAPCGTSITSNARLIATGYSLLNSPLGSAALAHARTSAMLFSILLLILVWLAARAWFGWLAAGFAAILTVFEPNLTAHGALVTTDMAIAATTLLAVFCADRYLRNPSIWRLLAAGAGLGLALASKHTGIFVPFIVLLQFAASLWNDQSSRTSRRVLTRLSLTQLAAWCAICLIAVAILWSVYGFRYSALPTPGAPHFDIAQMLNDSGRSQSIPGRATIFLARYHVLPESYLAGLAFVVSNSVRESFIFGKMYDTGVWFYFPATILVKTPLTILALVAFALFTPTLWRHHRRQFITALIPIAVFLAAAVTSKINLGVRHILPIYPFLVILAAAAAAYLFQRSRPLQVLCAALVVFQVASYARAFPGEIAYANELFGGQRNVRKILGESNVDWAQGLPAVKRYIDAHKITDCWIAYAGPQDPANFGIPCRALAGPSFLEAAHKDLPPVLPGKVSGTIFLSNILTNYAIFPYTNFLERTPDDVIDGSVLVFHGDFDLPQVAAERHVGRGWWYLYHQQGPQAAEEFAQAEPNVASPGILEGLYGWALEASGRPAEARVKYALAAKADEDKPAYVQARKAALARVAALSNASTK